MSVARALASEAADLVEAALDRENGEPGLPKNLAEQYRAAVTILRDAADPDTSESAAGNALNKALQQLQTPTMVFLPSDLTRDLEVARMRIDRARLGR